MGFRAPIVLVITAVVASFAGACKGSLSVTMQVVDEGQQPVSGVHVWYDGGETTTNDEGYFTLGKLHTPEMVVLSKDGYLDEPVTVGWTDQDGTRPVTLLTDGGNRLVIHSGGDVMLGRRYVDPDDEEDEYGPGDGLLVPGDGGASARALVRDLAPAFRAAHLRLVNLETVVGHFDEEDAYPGKRWILGTDPDALAALESLGVDAVILANNHQRDYMDEGVLTTLVSPGQHNLDIVGAGLSATAAQAPLILRRGGHRVGILAYTSVDGTYVNDAYPTDAETPPEELDEDEVWLWEGRSWGWSGGTTDIPEQDRRIGSAWAAFVEVEELLDEHEGADCWRSLTAVYPELQDWVARRGHGGGALWDSETSVAAIASLRSQVDLVVVNLHSGYQFSTAPSSGIQAAARAAIDAGADLVVGHHPHVLQGVEFYDDRLIVWSLGNFIFEQDFLSTFPSAYLRTVWEDGELLQAQLVPLVIEAYRPVPCVDDAARRTLASMWEQSLAGATSSRGSDGAIRSLLDEEAGEDAAQGQPRFRIDHHAAMISQGTLDEFTQPIELAGHTPTVWVIPGLTWLPLQDPAPDGVDVGRSLFGRGGFEDMDTDDRADDATHWQLDTNAKELVAERPHDGKWCMKIERSRTNTSDVVVHPIARITLPDHRLWWDEESPADGEPSYSLHLWTRIRGAGDRGVIRLTAYHFDDSNPSIAPISKVIRELEYPIVAVNGNTWQDVWIDIPPEDMAPDENGRRVSAVMFTIVVSPQDTGETTMWFDDIDLIEWRPAAQAPSTWGDVTWLRSNLDNSTTLEVRGNAW